MNKIGSAQAEIGQTAAAAETTRKALAIAEELARSDPENSQAQSDLSFAYTQLGKIESKSGNAIGAIGNYRKALEIDRRLAGAAPRNWEAQTEVASDWDLIAESQASLKRSAESIESYRQSIKIREAVAAGDPKSLEYRKDLASTLLKAARLLNGNAGSGAEARRMCERALQIFRSGAAGAQANEGFLTTYAKALLECEPADLRDPKEALRQALRAGRMAKEPRPELLDIQAAAYFENGDVRRAIALQEQALARIPALPEGEAPAGQRKTYLAHLRRYRAAYGKK
jgi:tetratricopeptide (TPR) repeat protein